MVDDDARARRCSTGVQLTNGARLHAPNVVLATGTFLGGKTFRGDEVRAEGRFGENPRSNSQARSPGSAFIGGSRPGRRPHRPHLGRPQRDERAAPERGTVRGLGSAARRCSPGRSSRAGWFLPTTRRIVLSENLPLAAVRIGPDPRDRTRYCPLDRRQSRKFAHNPAHQIFIEPEGWDEPTLYVGGFSTSLPADVQLEILRTLPGLGEVRMLRAATRSRYDFVPPTELDGSLETRRVARPVPLWAAQRHLGLREAAGQGDRGDQRLRCGRPAVNRCGWAARPRISGR